MLVPLGWVKATALMEDPHYSLSPASNDEDLSLQFKYHPHHPHRPSGLFVCHHTLE